MRILKPYIILVLIAGSTLLSGCATTQVGEAQSPAQAKVAIGDLTDLPACPSKWMAAGNNDAKADRYFQVSC